MKRKNIEGSFPLYLSTWCATLFTASVTSAQHFQKHYLGNPPPLQNITKVKRKITITILNPMMPAFLGILACPVRREYICI